VGAVGLGLSVVFLLLQAPDVAITQLAVEIIAVILLIRATLRTRLESSPVQGRLVGAMTALLFATVFIGVAAVAFRELPPFGRPLVRVAETYLGSGLQDTGAANIVAAVILDYRAYDTLGEAAVLFAAVIGVLTVLRSHGRDPSGGIRE
jgi:multisubunit Na+/H+ antiporter MnhB subunit